MKSKKEIETEDPDTNKSDSDIDDEMLESDVEMEFNDDKSYDENFNDSDQYENPTTKENPAWADAMSKILKTNKPKRRKTIVLSRAKRANEVKPVVKTETLDFEIEGGKEIDDVETVKSEKAEGEDEPQVKRLKKKEWASRGHVKPDILEKDREKALLKIATRGVVQLFNAVREHQKTLKKDLEDAGPVEYKKDKVMKSLDKRAFLDVLMGPSKSQPVDKLVSKEESDNPTWSILRDDFMMSSKLKDWDKQDVEEIKDEPDTI